MTHRLSITQAETVAHGWTQFVWTGVDLPNGHWWLAHTDTGPIFLLWPVASGWLCCSPETEGRLHGQQAQLSGRTMPSPTSVATAILARGADILAALALIAYWRTQPDTGPMMVIGEWSQNLPFQLQPSRFLIPNLPPEVTASIGLLEDWSIPARFCANTWLPGTYEGSLKALVSRLSPQWRTVSAQWPPVSSR